MLRSQTMSHEQSRSAKRQQRLTLCLSSSSRPVVSTLPSHPDPASPAVPMVTSLRARSLRWVIHRSCLHLISCERLADCIFSVTTVLRPPIEGRQGQARRINWQSLLCCAFHIYASMNSMNIWTNGLLFRT
jgi:hypothetical protein